VSRDGCPGGTFSPFASLSEKSLNSVRGKRKRYAQANPTELHAVHEQPLWTPVVKTPPGGFPSRDRVGASGRHCADHHARYISRSFPYVRRVRRNHTHRRGIHRHPPDGLREPGEPGGRSPEKSPDHDTNPGRKHGRSTPALLGPSPSCRRPRCGKMVDRAQFRNPSFPRRRSGPGRNPLVHRRTQRTARAGHPRR